MILFLSATKCVGADSISFPGGTSYSSKFKKIRNPSFPCFFIIMNVFFLMVKLWLRSVHSFSNLTIYGTKVSLLAG